MRFFVVVFSLLFLVSCNKEKNFVKPNWLTGKWVKTNNDSAKITYEFWNTDFIGLGFTLQESDTVFIEKMRVVSDKDIMYLQVIGVGDRPTFFVFTEQTESSFTVENDQNEFPKKIKYQIENDTLKAIISNSDFSVNFNFVKLEE